MFEKTLGEKTVFEGRALKIDVLDIEMAHGVRSVREIVRHPGAVVVLGELPKNRFVLVRQYRKAIESSLLEAVAGTLEPGEKPATCAERELGEESGYKAKQMRSLGEIVPAPGYSQERLYLFHALLDPEAGNQAPDEDEFLERVILDGKTIQAMIRKGDIQDAKTIAIWHLFMASKED